MQEENPGAGLPKDEGKRADLSKPDQAVQFAAVAKVETQADYQVPRASENGRKKGDASWNREIN